MRIRGHRFLSFHWQFIASKRFTAFEAGYLELAAHDLMKLLYDGRCRKGYILNISIHFVDLSITILTLFSDFITNINVQFGSTYLISAFPYLFTITTIPPPVTHMCLNPGRSTKSSANSCLQQVNIESNDPECYDV